MQCEQLQEHPWVQLKSACGYSGSECMNALGCSGCVCIVLVGAVLASVSMPMGAVAVPIRVKCDCSGSTFKSARGCNGSECCVYSDCGCSGSEYKNACRCNGSARVSVSAVAVHLTVHKGAVAVHL